jgi:carbon starvation protein CstA
MSSARPDTIVRVARFVGDFSNPFYAEERQRDVWNEASAFGLQLVIWCALTICTVTVWLVGASSVPYVCAAMLLVGAIGGLTVAYAQHLGVDLTAREHLLRWRMLPYAVLVVALAVGLLRAQAQPLDPATLAGMATGAAVGVLAAVAGLRRSRQP